MRDRVSFTRMDEGTPEDFALLLAREREEKADLPGRVLDLLRQLAGTDTGYRVDRLEHSLQTATRAKRSPLAWSAKFVSALTCSTV